MPVLFQISVPCIGISDNMNIYHQVTIQSHYSKIALNAGCIRYVVVKNKYMFHQHIIAYLKWNYLQFIEYYFVTHFEKNVTALART